MITLVHARVGPPWSPLSWGWWTTFDHESPWCVLTCAKGHTGTLDVPGLHRVAADGTVTPSCVCPAAGCGWHEFVRLENWPQTGAP